MYDHLEGEANDDIKYRSREEREDPVKILAILQELYGCSQSYVALQEALFSLKQQEGEYVQVFSHALLCLKESVINNAPHDMPNAETLLRDQFVEYIYDCALRRELKHFVHEKPDSKLLDVHMEAISEGVAVDKVVTSDKVEPATDFPGQVRVQG